MKQYIDKVAVVEEIERLRKNNELKEDKDYAQFTFDVACGYDIALNDVEKSFNTLEVKEVDLDKELNRIWFDNKFGSKFNDSIVDFANVEEICKYFFELGLKVRQ